MINKVLAQKWRPQVFSDVIGQKPIILAIENSLLLNRFHNAYLFSGIRGVGKTTIARLLAKALNCDSKNLKPCDACNNCIEVRKGCFVDLIEIDAASKTKVEDTRELIDNAQYFPVHGRFKIYLIDEVHMLSRYSFNALLKILEEPPQHVKFLFATTHPKKIPVTILSRCLHFHLKLIDDNLISDQLKIILKKENINFEEDALSLISSFSEGSMRDALSLTDHASAIGNGNITVRNVHLILGNIDEDKALELIENIAKKNSKKILELVENIASFGVEWDNILIDMLRLLHKISILQVTSLGKQNNSEKTKRLQRLAKQLTTKDVQWYYKILLIGRKDIKFAPNARIGFEIILLRALYFYPVFKH